MSLLAWVCCRCHLAHTSPTWWTMLASRLREQARFGTFKYKSMWQSLRLIAREEVGSLCFMRSAERGCGPDRLLSSGGDCYAGQGRKGLYAGMGTHVARVVPNTAIMFLRSVAII